MLASMRLALACAQFAAAPADVAANLAKIDGLAREAAARGAAVAVFPELCLSGYLPAGEIERYAAAVDGPELSRVAGTARAARIAVAVGFAEHATDGRLHSSMAFIGRDGTMVAVQRKAHLFGPEPRWATRAETAAAFDALGLRCGAWVCYDTRFPELARRLALDGATLCFAGAAWLGPADEWELAVRARAMDNGIYVAAAALQGTGRGFTFRGTSLVADPHGRVAARAPEGDGVIVAEYDDAVVSEFRGRVPLLEHRRPDLLGG
jgi:predicted amidohydrolase